MMDSQKLIKTYVDEVVVRLPGRQRADVAFELSALLTEEVQAQTGAAGAPADPDLTLEVLRAFGRPAEVAARYRPTPALLDPADTRDFLIAAAAGSVAWLALGAVTLHDKPPKDWPTIVVLSWLGFLVILFAGLNAARRRWPALAQWKPRDPDHANRAAHLALVGVIAMGVVAYGAPAWVFAELTGGLRLTPWFDYAPDFQTYRLPWLLGLWCLTGLLILVVVVEGRWRPLTRRIEAALQLAVGLVLSWFFFAGPMFLAPALDRSMKTGLGVAIVVVLVDAGFKVRRVMRAGPPAGGFAPPRAARQRLSRP